MSKQGLLITILIGVLIGGCFIAMKEKTQNKSETAMPDKEATQSKKPTTELQAKSIHSDILKLIESQNKTISGISPATAKKELESRIGKKEAIDGQPINLKALPFDILSIIAKSSTTVAKITPKQASNEIIKRYLVIDMGNEDSDEISNAILLKKFIEKDEQVAINKWADNEDAEAVEKFLREDADKDPKSVSNIALALKYTKNKDKLGEAKTYMDRYAEHVDSDSFDNQDEKQSYEDLIKQIKKLVG